MQTALPVADVLCIYGLPDHELHLELKGWLEDDQERFLVILEDDPKILLNQTSHHERMYLCQASNETEIKKILWELVFLRFEYLTVPGNSSKDRKKMDRVFAHFVHFQEGIHLTASDFQHRGINLLHNYLTNYASFSKVKKGKELFGKFKNHPAIICGAGLSLEKEIEALRALKEQALLFAGGTALSSLAEFGMSPHFGAFIDPHPPTKRSIKNGPYDIPLFFQSRVHPKQLQQAQGPLLWIPGSGNDLLEKETFDGGWNVSTFLVCLAYHLGCNPIVLVGVDLCQEEKKSYAASLEREEEGELISLPNGQYTRRDWLFAAEWLTGFAREHKEVEWINASDGLLIEGYRKQHLKEIDWSGQADFSADIDSQIQQIKEGVECGVDPIEMQKSFAKVGTLCDEMLALLERLFPKLPEKSGEYLLLEVEIEKEIAYQQFLRPIWNIWKYVLSRQIPKDIPPAYGIGLNQWLFIKGICDDARKI